MTLGAGTGSVVESRAALAQVVKFNPENSVVAALEAMTLGSVMFVGIGSVFEVDGWGGGAGARKTGGGGLVGGRGGGCTGV